MKHTNNFQIYMEKCDQLAIKAKERGNAPVGCIILFGNEIIAEAEEAGHSKQDISYHAEMEAIRNARKIIGVDMSECTLVSTHEPCIMCGYAIRYHKIKKVVYKNPVEYLGSINSSMKVLVTEEVPKHWSKSPEVILFTK